MSTIKSISWGADLGAVYENLPYRGHSALHNTRIIYDFDADYGDVIVDDGSAADTGYFTIRSSVITPNQKPDIGVELNTDHPLAQGLVGYWLMNEGAGKLTQDISGNSNHGTMISTMSWGSGQTGSSLAYPGGDQYVTTPKPAIAGSSQLSVCGWFWIDGIKDHWAVSLGVPSPESYILLWADATVIPTGNNSWSFNVGPTGDNGNRIGGPSNLWIQKGWQHVCGVMNGKFRGLYFNGKLVAAQSGSGYLTLPNYATQSLSLGYWSGGSKYYTGMMEQVSIYDRALSSNEIAWLYSEPYCMLEYPTRKHISVPISAGNSFSAYWPIEINADSVISSDVTDWPCLITDIHFPEEAWSFMNPDASDLRFTSDAEGLTELYFDLVRIDVANKSAHIYVRVPNLNSGSITTIYAWVGNRNAVAKSAAWMQGAYPSDWAAFWLIEEGSGTTVYDRTANGSTGTLVNGPAWAQQVDGSWAIDFASAGSANRYIELSSVPVADGASFSIALRTWLPATIGGPCSAFCEMSNTSGGNYQYWLHVGTTGLLVIDSWPPSGQPVFGAATDLRNAWHTIGAETGSSLARLLVDGEQDGNLITREDGTAALNIARIGGRHPSSDTMNLTYWRGLIANCCLWSRTLSDNEWAIHHLMLNSPATFAAAGEFDFQ